jgi:hypothetical protein
LWSGDRDVAEDTALIVVHGAVSAPACLVCLITRLKPSVRGLDRSWVSATGMAGHQVWMVVASRVVYTTRRTSRPAGGLLDDHLHRVLIDPVNLEDMKTHPPGRTTLT